MVMWCWEKTPGWNGGLGSGWKKNSCACLGVSDTIGPCVCFLFDVDGQLPTLIALLLLLFDSSQGHLFDSLLSR